MSRLADSRVGVLGYGLEGTAAVRALERWGCSRIVVLTDAEPETPAFDVTSVWGDETLEALRECDLLIRSPGIRPSHRWLTRARASGIPVTTATNLFVERAHEAGLPVIGITGSKGKSTTASLAHAILVEAGVEARLVGNIGTPCLDALDDVVASRALTVFEMSSYQTWDLAAGPDVAALLRLFPEHLDWHGGVEEYYEAKCRIGAAQQRENRVVYNAGDPEIVRRLPLGPGSHVAFNDPVGLHYSDGWFFRGRARLFADAAMRLRGRHNRVNACAALAAAEPFGAEACHLERVVATFRGLPHRLEEVGVVRGILWVNDSISTAPEAAIAALDAFGREVATYIGGGTDRGFDFAPLAASLLASSVRCVILVPPGGERIREAIVAADAAFSERIALVRDLGEAVRLAAATTPEGKVCLFSPASPSYGTFRDFRERGETFRRFVAELANGDPVSVPGS